MQPSKFLVKCTFCLLLLLGKETAVSDDRIHPCINTTNVVLTKIDSTFLKEDIPALWTRYKTDPGKNRAKYLRRILSLNPIGVSSNMEKEFCHAFRETPLMELAGVLGMCKSEESRQLLFAFNPSDSNEWNAWHLLARAKRGDKMVESNLIEKVNSLLSSVDISYRDYRDIAVVVSYLGHPKCVKHFFDGIARSINKSDKRDIQLDQFLYQTLKQSDNYFSALGLPELSKNKKGEIDKHSFPEWWKNNHERFSSILFQDVGKDHFLKLHYSILLF